MYSILYNINHHDFNLYSVRVKLYILVNLINLFIKINVPL